MKLMKNVLMRLHMLALSVFILLTACGVDEKIDKISEQEKMEIAQENQETETTIDEELLTFDETLLTAENGRVAGETCVAVMLNQESKKITLDFGDGCIGAYGRERSGKVIITYGGAFADYQANRIITFENYKVNNKQLTGSIELRDYNLDASSQLTSTRKLIDFAIHFPVGSSFKMSGSTTITWIEGANDLDPTNNIFTVSGSYEGVSSRGRTITYTILEPIVVKFNCYSQGAFVRVSGLKEVRVTNDRREKTHVIDFGDGLCDKLIEVTIDGRVYSITVE